MSEYLKPDGTFKTVGELTDDYIEHRLATYTGRIQDLATSLGIDQATLYRKRKRMGKPMLKRRSPAGPVVPEVSAASVTAASLSLLESLRPVKVKEE